MSTPAPALSQTAFPEQFELSLERSFRRSFIWLAAAYVAVLLILTLRAFIATPDEVWHAAGSRAWLRILLLVLAMAACGGLLALNLRRSESRRRIMPVINTMTLLVGATILGSRLLMAKADPMLPAWGLGDLFALHLVACMLLPWRPSESILPFVPLILLWGAVALIPRSDWDMFSRAVGGIAAFAILLPGWGVTAWKFRRSREDFDRVMLGQQVQTMGGELSRARIVHDAMFPKAMDTGHIQFEYEYVPMQELGGDYVHVHHCRASGRVYLTLLDVAGHGLAAALTVNRLFGELERIRAENADAEPGDVMELLNRYINLTMAPYNLYATGACIMVDPATGELKWVNAGHPPALIRRAAGEGGPGAVEELAGTTMMLGACSYAEFEAKQRSLSLQPGDVVIAYTDGAFEARDRFGKRFGLKGLREVAAFTPAPRSWTRFIATAVGKHLHPPAEDDMLLASLTFGSFAVRQSPETGAADGAASAAAQAPATEQPKKRLTISD